MQEVIRLFKQIKETSGTNDKKAIITANKENELFKKCLRFLLDSNITTGIAKKKYESLTVGDSDWVHSDIDKEFCELLDYIKEHNTGRDEDVIQVQAWCYEMSDEVKEFVKGMITKSIKLGCDKKVVNSCIPNLIPSWDIQQAHSLSEKTEPKDGDWFALSQKLNGVNASYYKGKMISRQGKEIKGLQHIINDIEKLPRHNECFFNGELIRKNIDNLPDDENFQIGTGVINSDSDKSCIEFKIYEALPIEEFEKGESKLTYKNRRETFLSNLETEISKQNLENVIVVPLLYEGTDKSKIQELLNEADSYGWEGLMLNKDAKWKNKRNNGILKVKSWKNADILCTGVIEGDGKNKGTLGSIECDYKGYKLRVPGFKDEMRNYYWNNPNEIVGKIVQIKYKGETKNKQGGLSVQFPEFQCIRYDKTEPSYE